MDDLVTTLGLRDRELVSVVGGGGKTTLLFELGRLLRSSVVVTTTTKMSADRSNGFPVLIDPSDEVLHAAALAHPAVVAWQAVDGSKALGVAPERADRWYDHRCADYVLVEADGARRHPFKAPGPLEPVIPSRSTTVVVVAGASAFGRVIADQCHRPLRVAALAGCQPYERLTPARAVRVLTSERGSFKSVPPGAATALYISQVTEVNRPLADAVAAGASGTFDRVVVA